MSSRFTLSGGVLRLGGDYLEFTAAAPPSEIMALLDSISGIIAAYGFRQLMSGYSGACIQVKNTSTSVLSNLPVNFTKAQADALGTNLQVVKLYDLTGGGNHAASMTGTNPVLQFDTYNRPFLDLGSSANIRFDSVSGVTFTAPKYFDVIYFKGGVTQYLHENGGNYFAALFLSGYFALYNGTAANFDAQILFTWLQYTSYFQSGADRAFKNGTEMIGGGTNAGDTPRTAVMSLFNPTGSSATYGFAGYWMESIIFDGAITDANRSAIEANQKTVLIDAIPLVITTVSPLSGASVGVSYPQIISASGGTGSFTFSLAAGSSLPAGLSLSMSGAISGTPTAGGVYSFTISVSDGTSTATKVFSLTISSPDDFTWNHPQIPEYYNVEEPLWETVTRSNEYEDGGKTFNELNSVAPQGWTLTYTGVSTADGLAMDVHYNSKRLSRDFSFVDKAGTTNTNVYYKSYKRSHEKNKVVVSYR